MSAPAEDRRTTFFSAAAALCFLLVPAAGDYGWVAAAIGATYVGLAGATWLDDRTRRGG